MIDFEIRLQVGDSSTESIKYSELPVKSEALITAINEFPEAMLGTVEFHVTAMSYAQSCTFFKLLNKARNHIFYHAGRRAPIQVLESSPIQGSEGYTLGNLCRLDVISGSLRPSAEVKITFDNLVEIKDQTTRGATIVANAGRLANALAFSLQYEAKLSPKPITLETWNQLTVKCENPWHKVKTIEQAEADRQESLASARSLPTNSGTAATDTAVEHLSQEQAENLYAEEE